MNIALYYPWIYLKSGIERTILETIKGSHHQYTIFTNHYDKDGTYPEFKNFKIVELKKISVRRDLSSVLRSALIICFQKISLNNFSLLLVHSEGLGDLILLRNKTIPTVCFCHTPLRAVFDEEYRKRAINSRGLVEKTMYFIFSFIFKVVDRYLWSKYTYIFLNSKNTLQRAQRGGLLIKKHRYALIYPGCNWERVNPTWTYRNYFLVPGRIMWTKNIELAIESFKIFCNKIKPEKKFRIIIAGQVDKKSEPYYKKLKNQAAFNKKIEFVRDPNDKKMGELYSACCAVLATSFNEDWGLAPIEANSYGKPALCVNSGGFKESQINGKTGFLLAATPEAFSHKMIFLSKNRKYLLKMGRFARINSKKYDWESFISRLDDLIDAAA